MGQCLGGQTGNDNNEGEKNSVHTMGEFTLHGMNIVILSDRLPYFERAAKDLKYLFPVKLMFEILRSLCSLQNDRGCGSE